MLKPERSVVTSIFPNGKISRPRLVVFAFRKASNKNIITPSTKAQNSAQAEEANLCITDIFVAVATKIPRPRLGISLGSEICLRLPQNRKNLPQGRFISYFVDLTGIGPVPRQCE